MGSNRVAYINEWEVASADADGFGGCLALFRLTDGAKLVQDGDLARPRPLHLDGDEIPKPYSAYTIFWRLERMYILQQAEKYSNLILPPYWYSSAHRKEDEKKRKHRKLDGSIDKNDLTAMIAKSWREVDINVRTYVSKLAAAEKRKYAAIKSTTQTEPKAQPQITSVATIPPRSQFLRVVIQKLATSRIRGTRNSLIKLLQVMLYHLISHLMWLEEKKLIWGHCRMRIFHFLIPAA
ncbi:hypothetical protein ACHAWO_002418 [Cyclotella atomus]|uniref:HMG box domain-containing protein n=1 Tax=Cyclotella atomus TaxID=382360 RepID=A0ABD3PGE2_9STRA